MEGTKLDIAAKEKEPLSPSATYKQIPEDDMDDTPSRPKSVAKEENGTEHDGADEKMLANTDTKVGPNSNINLTEVKFTSNEKNGDAKLDIGEFKNEFVGLTKEELMKCANDPFWVRLRWILFISFWLLWAGMLIGAILIIVAAPKCTPPTPKTWWEEGPLVDVQTTESEAIEKVTADKHAFIIKYPVDTYNITPEFESFLAENKDSHIIVELDPTVSYAWFADSEAKGAYNEYYIWGGEEGAASDKYPNNWLAKTSSDEAKKSAWQYSNVRKQFYFAPDGKPHLNFRNAKVQDEFKKVLTRLFDDGVDGVRLKNVPGLFVDPEFADEALKQTPGNNTLDSYDFYTHFKTENLKEIQPVVREWRNIVKNKTDNGAFMLSDEITTLDPYKFNGTLLVDLPKHRDVFSQKELNASKLLNAINASSIFLENNWPAWQISNTAYPEGTLEIVTYLLKGVPVLRPSFQVTEELKEARKSPSILFGTQKLYTAANDTVFAYVRSYPSNPGYLVAFNPTDQQVSVDFPTDIPEVPDEVTIQYFSTNYNETDVTPRVKKSAKEFPISAKSAIILSYVPK